MASWSLSSLKITPPARFDEAALAVAKAKGMVLGNYKRIAAAKQRATTTRAERLRPVMTELANLSTRAAADALNHRGIKTASGGSWFPMQVHRALLRHYGQGCRVGHHDLWSRSSAEAP